MANTGKKCNSIPPRTSNKIGITDFWRLCKEEGETGTFSDTAQDYLNSELNN